MNQEMTEIELYRQETKVLEETHQIWLPSYEIIHPKPIKSQGNRLEINWWATAGWIFVIGVVCLGIFVSARTGVVIGDANNKEGFTGFGGFSLTVAGLIGIEGFAILFGFFRPRSIRGDKLIDKIADGFEKSLGWLSLIVVLFISATAGWIFFLKADEYTDPVKIAASWKVLSFSLGVGLSLVLFGVSEFAGRLKWLHDNMPTILEYEFQKAMALWRNEMQLAWQQSAIYIEVTGDRQARAEKKAYDIANATRGRTKVLAAQNQAEIDGLTHQPQVVERIVEHVSAPAQPQTQVAPPVKKLVRQWLNTNNIPVADLLNGNLPKSPAEIAEELSTLTGLEITSNSVRPALSKIREEKLQSVKNNGR